MLALVFAGVQVSEDILKAARRQGQVILSVHYDQNIFVSILSMWSLQQKQKYLREHLDKDQFQEFFQYIQDEVGNFNIEKWANEFVIEIVNKFKSKKEEDNKNLETSFFHYQANEALSAVASMILGTDIQNIKESERENKDTVKEQKILDSLESENKVSPEAFKKGPKKIQPEVQRHNKEVPKQVQIQPIKPIKKLEQNLKAQYQTKKEPKKEQSAFDLLDSFLKKPVQTQDTIGTTANPQHFKTISHPDKSQTVNANQFASNQFWGIGTANKGHKISKPTADFASFDFWSQPASSPQGTKHGDFDITSEKSFIKKEEKGKEEVKNSTLSFDDLLVNCQVKNEPSPYQKKSNHHEVSSQKEKDKQKGKRKSEIIEKTVEKPIQKEKQQSVRGRKKTAKVLYDGQIVLKQSFQKSVKCFPSHERSKLKDPKLRATIQGHQIVQRTFLMPDYTMYLIKIHPLNITCKRNYEDFQRLKGTLTKLFPGAKLAFLESNSWFSATNLEFIKSQKVMLQFFLNDLIKNPQIRNSKILEDFITMTEHKSIKRKFEEWDKLQAPKSIEDLCLLGGRVEVNLSEHQRLYQQNFKRYNTRLIQFLQRHQKLSNALASQYRQIQQTENTLISVVKGMIDETTYFNERVYDLQLQKIGKALQRMHNAYSQENKNTKFHREVLESTIAPFVKYQRQNVTELQELIETQQKFFKTYLKRSAYEKIDDAMPYTSDKIKPFKVGVLEESKNCIVLKYQAGFLSNQMCAEGYRVVQTLGDKLTSLFDNYAQKSRSNYEDILYFWTRGIYLENAVPT